ncbi:MAG: CobB/CobQ domain protein glutamine amidotransferase [Candidatus Gottesmanbacteria bacterium GW2011_GWB1_43_11]|uniref:CobB/CobQ domain protein glutamine amidotransferase n=1 Tax=Candidatus Gottesmanbacteria bacterium GW2011_GWB1_43_11 TaxID=1618446 RepID=A0A0G1CKP7_9BACT|nr:MAG: CobB/CobQ domain protein glutamine amidotransferase [Candidatus Gottesmanbacteria bacterium GW2011_GWB1_43_11]
MNFRLNLAWMYPDLMSTYGDRGNIIVLTKRCQWRGIEVNIKEITLETKVSELSNCDLIFMGGAQDRQQSQAVDWKRSG